MLSGRNGTGQNGKVSRSAPLCFCCKNINVSVVLLFQMVRNYTRKTDRQKWDENAMSEAIEVVISGEMGFLKAARQFNVPKSSLERYVNKKKKNPEYKVDKTDGKFKNVFF